MIIYKLSTICSKKEFFNSVFDWLDTFPDVKPDLKDTVSVAESVKSEKSTTEAVTSSSTQDRGMKRDASAANIRTPSLQDGKKLKMQWGRRWNVSVEMSFSLKCRKWNSEDVLNYYCRVGRWLNKTVHDRNLFVVDLYSCLSSNGQLDRNLGIAGLAKVWETWNGFKLFTIPVS